MEMANAAEIREENRRVRRLAGDGRRRYQRTLAIGEEAAELVANTRRFALSLFPDKGLAYDLIYAPRFQRLMWEKNSVV
jgi:hypothetical protein